MFESKTGHNNKMVATALANNTSYENKYSPFLNIRQVNWFDFLN